MANTPRVLRLRGECVGCRYWTVLRWGGYCRELVEPHWACPGLTWPHFYDEGKCAVKDRGLHG